MFHTAFSVILSIGSATTMLIYLSLKIIEKIPVLRYVFRRSKLPTLTHSYYSGIKLLPDLSCHKP